MRLYAHFWFTASAQFDSNSVASTTTGLCIHYKVQSSFRIDFFFHFSIVYLKPWPFVWNLFVGTFTNLRFANKFPFRRFTIRERRFIRSKKLMFRSNNLMMFSVNDLSYKFDLFDFGFELASENSRIIEYSISPFPHLLFQSSLFGKLKCNCKALILKFRISARFKCKMEEEREGEERKRTIYVSINSVYIVYNRKC